MWQEVQGQRKERFSSIGDIEFGAFEFLFDLREIDENDQELLYTRVMHIDHLVRARLEKKSPPKKGAEK